MKNLINFKKSIILILLILLGTFGLVAWNSVENLNQSRVQVENNISSISVVSLREVRTNSEMTTFEIIVKNNSPKPILVVTLKHENSETSKKSINTSGIDGFMSDWRLMPNSNANLIFTAPPTGNVKVIVSAIMFEDGATQGDPFISEKMRNERNGIKFVLQKVLPILQKGKNLPGDDIPDELIQRITDEVLSVEKQGIPKNFLGSFIDVKDLIISDLNELKRFKQEKRNDPQFKPKNHFSKKTTSLERAFSRL